MYIRELQLDGFGALNGAVCVFDAPVTIVYGPNEAGKSTLLRFMRTMLYGFANRGQPAERAEPVFGGRHGGRLLLVVDGRELVLERYADAPSAGRRGGAMAVLRDAAGTERPIAQGELERLLLGGVSERLFRQLFAVTLDDLQEVRSLRGEEVGNYLYHTGMAGGAALTAANKALAAEMDKLFKPRGAQPELNRALAELRELEAELRQARQHADAYNEAVAALEAAEREVSEAELRLPELRSRVLLAESASGAREWWLRAQALAAELAELEAGLPADRKEPLAEDAAPRWEAVLAERGRAAEKAEQAAGETGRLRGVRESLVWDAELVRRSGEIEALEAQSEAAAARREELTELAADLRLQDETLAALLGRLAPGWGVPELAAFASLPERERARALQSGLAEAQRAVERLDAELRRLERQQISLADGEDDAGERGSVEDGEQLAASAAGAAMGADSFVPQTRGELLQVWRRLEDEWRQWELARATAAAYAAAPAPDVENGGDAAASAGLPSAEAGEDAAGAQLGRSRTRSRSGAGSASARGGAGNGGRGGREPRAASWRAMALLALGAAIAALAPMLLHAGAAASAALYTAAAALAAAAGWSALGGVGRSAKGWAAAGPQQPPGTAERAREAAAELAMRERRVDAALQGLLREPQAAARTAWPALRDAVHARLELFEARERTRLVRQERERRLAEWRREREQLASERRAALEALSERQERWAAWLDERGLPPGLAPELLPELLQLAEQALQTARQRGRLAERAAALQAGAAEFEAAAAALFAACPPPAGAADAAIAAKLLHREAMRQRETAAEARRLDERLREAEAAEASARAALAGAAQTAAALMAAAGEMDEAAYERRLRIEERRRELSRERREAELRLAAGRDASGLAALEDVLARHDEAALAQLLADAEAALAAEEARRTEALDRRGRLAQQLERQRREAETEGRRFAAEELQAEVDRLAERYAVLALAAELIRRTKTIFEADKQPEVLLRASDYFAAMTEGRYSRIVAPEDSESLLAETRDRRLIDSALLSRGTREQLYLALRFALAGATSPGQALPLLLDDLFVHFDADRLRAAIGVVERVSRERQVVLFTCHESLAEQAAASLPAARLIRLARAGSGAEAAGLSR